MSQNNYLRRSGCFVIFLRLVGLLGTLSAGATEGADSSALIWPTPNPAFQEGEPIEAFVQATASGRVESGLFGCVRNSGSRFHGGLDLFPIRRDSRGEALDPIYAVLPGEVVYVNNIVGHSSYGRYVVVVHDGESPAFHTLYAHLASVASVIKAGTRVESGAVLGRMGRSAGGYSIPRSRAHLHFEIGVRLTNDFQGWFNRQRFGSQNHHGMWNGMNLEGVDPLDFYRLMRQGRISNFKEYLQLQPAVARIRVYTSQVPSFATNYPALVTRPHEAQTLIAWDIAFTQHGLPKEWTPRFAEEGLDGRAGDVQVLAYNPNLLEGQSCRRVVDLGAGGPKLSSGTLNTLKKLFGFQ